jgi:hypothetical protein
LFISCGFCCGKKSAGIPKDLLADLVLRRITCGFGVFRKIRRYFLRIFLRFCHQEEFPADLELSEKSTGISEDFPADFFF